VKMKEEYLQSENARMKRKKRSMEMRIMKYNLISKLTQIKKNDITII